WTGNDNNAVVVYMTASDGQWWELDFRAPPGQVLTPGTYTDVVRAADQGPGLAGMDVSGNYRGCNTIAGSFTVVDATIAPTTYLDSLDVTFEQHCDGAPAALRGEVRVV